MSSAGQRPAVGVRVPPCVPARAFADAAVRAERLGFAAVWVPDAPLMWRDPWACLALAAHVTSRIGLGVAATNPITRHPAVTATAAATIAEDAPSRVTVCVGTGNSAVRVIGHRPAGMPEVREMLDALRVLLRGRGRAVDFGGGPVRLAGATDPPPAVWAAATGTRALAAAGAYANGVVLDVGLHPDAVTEAIATAGEAAVAAGRDPGHLAVAAVAHVRVTADIARDARRLKPLIAGLSTTPGGRAALDRCGIPVPTVPPLPAGAGSDWMHATVTDGLDDHVSDQVAATFAQRWCLWGDEGRLTAKLTALADIGVHQVILHHGEHQHLPDLDALAAAAQPGTATPAAGGTP